MTAGPCPVLCQNEIEGPEARSSTLARTPGCLEKTALSWYSEGVRTRARTPCAARPKLRAQGKEQHNWSVPKKRPWPGIWGGGQRTWAPTKSGSELLKMVLWDVTATNFARYSMLLGSKG